MTTNNNEPMDCLSESIGVSFTYPVLFCRDVFSKDNPGLADIFGKLDSPRPRALIWFDQGFSDAWPGIIQKAVDYFSSQAPDFEIRGTGVFPGGESVKDGFNHVNQMIRDLETHKLCRKSFVIAAGGGAFLDAAGFAASLVHRGINLIRLPTTVLSQNDSGVGVKNGINLHNKKNFLGVFAPPSAVVCDLDFLKTLPDDVMQDGLAEAFKVAIIKDAAFFGFLMKNAPALSRGEPDVLETTIKRCAQLHLSHIAAGGDPFERGVSRPLDFGHWAAHRLESMSGYALRHGQAVSVGLALDSCYACFQNFINEPERDAILNGLEGAGLPIWTDFLNQADEVLKGIEEFREHLGGTLAITLPQGIGGKLEKDRIDNGLVKKSIAFLEQRHSNKK